MRIILQYTKVEIPIEFKRENKSAIERSGLLVFERVVDVPVRIPVFSCDPPNQFLTDVFHHFIKRRVRFGPFFGSHI